MTTFFILKLKKQEGVEALPLLQKFNPVSYSEGAIHYF